MLEVPGSVPGGGRETGEKEGTLKWVQASNGEIPDDAVEGGWCHSTKEKIYVARAKSYNCTLTPGALKKSAQGCTYSKDSYQQHSNVYEVLVNPGNRAALQWVTSKAPVPPSAVEGGFSAPGMTLYVGRQSTNKKDIVPGHIDPANGLLHLIGSKYKAQTFKTFEVLVISGDVEIVEEINRCTLDNISYDVRQSDLTEECVTMATMAFENKSSLEQTLSSTAIMQYSDLYNWNIGKKTTYNVSTSHSLKANRPDDLESGLILVIKS